MNVYLRQQKMHDIEIEKAKLSIEAKEKAALEEEDCWIYALIGVKPPTPMVEKSIEEMVLVRTGLVRLELLTLNVNTRHGKWPQPRSWMQTTVFGCPLCLAGSVLFIGRTI